MSPKSKNFRPGSGGKNWQILVVILLFLSTGCSVKAQYVGTTCGYDYSSDLEGPDTGTDNTPLFNPVPGNPNGTWDDWAEEMAASGVDFVCPNLRGSYPNTSVNPTNIASLLIALSKRGLTNQIKLAIFDDNASSWTAQYNQALGNGYGYTVPFDIGNTNNWVYLWDYNYKLFYQTVPDSNRFKIKGRPVIIIWSGSTYFTTNLQGNASRALIYVRQQCQSTFGFNPFIILSSDFLSNDTTCKNTNVTDAIEAWFDPNSTHTNGQTLSTFNGIKIGALCPQYQDPNTDPSSWLDPQHGAAFAYGLTNTVGAGALLTLVEGFSDWEEDAACFRVRNLDANGNVLNYTNTYYDFPNQRLNLLRQYGSHPFPVELKFETEDCDNYGGAAGGNGQTNYYRNGNIAIETTSDVGGGYDVGWIQPGEWLEWEQVPMQGSHVHLQVRVASPNSNSQLHFVIDGTNYPEMLIPNTGGYQTWETLDSGTAYQFAKGSTHTVMLVCDTGGFNINYWQYHDVIPIGANINLQSKASSKWVSASNTTLSANVQVPGTNESFAVVDASSLYGYGYIALLAHADGLFVTADTNGVLPLTATGTTIGTPQMFEWTDNGDGTILLRAVANSMMVSATNNPSSYPLIPNGIRCNDGLPETFAVTEISSDSLSFVAQPNDAAAATAITAGALGEVQVLAVDGSGKPISGVTVTLGLASGTGILTGNSATTDANGIAHFTNLQINKVGAKTLLASNPSFETSVSASFTITAGPAATLTVESAADGSGEVVPAENVTAGSSLNVYAILRDSGGNFLTNPPATWSLVDITGGVVAGDLVASGDGQSATFTGHAPGSAVIQAGASFTGQSGIQTVVPAVPLFSSGTFTNNTVLALAGTPIQEFYGVSLGNGTAHLTANGYAFGSYPNVNASYGGSSAYGLGVFLGGGGTSGDTNFDEVLNYAELGINNGVLTLNNLRPGARYAALFLAADTRNGMGTRTFAITTAGASSPEQSYAYAGGNPYLGGYILCTFVATGTTQTFTNNQGAFGYQLNSVLVENAPVNTPAVITASSFNGSNIVLSGADGPAGGMYQILCSTNLAAPLATWTPVATNYFDGAGAFSNAIRISATGSAQFYRLVQP